MKRVQLLRMQMSHLVACHQHVHHAFLLITTVKNVTATVMVWMAFDAVKARVVRYLSQ